LVRTSQKLSALSKRIAHQPEQIHALECNKRQPMSLGDMRKEYDADQKEYERLANQQHEIFFSICEKRRMRIVTLSEK